MVSCKFRNFLAVIYSNCVVPVFQGGDLCIIVEKRPHKTYWFSGFVISLNTTYWFFYNFFFDILLLSAPNFVLLFGVAHYIGLSTFFSEIYRLSAFSSREFSLIGIFKKFIESILLWYILLVDLSASELFVISSSHFLLLRVILKLKQYFHFLQFKYNSQFEHH